MATAAELLANGLGHDDTTLVIDNYLRTIHIPKRITNLGVEYDDDVLRLNFKMPRYLDDTDLSTFSIRINYVNANGDGDIYTVSDKVVNPDSIAFSWLVGPTATAYKGKTKFNVCMKTVDEDGNVQREYNTAIASLPVLEGLEVDEQVAAMYSDLIEQWKRELFGIGDTEEASMRAVSQEEQENIAQKGAEVLATIPEEYQNTASAAQEGIRTKADAIVNVAEGQMITVSDSSDDHIRNLRIFGKTSQAADPAPSAPQALTSLGEAGTVGITLAGKNLINIHRADIGKISTTATVEGESITVATSVDNTFSRAVIPVTYPINTPLTISFDATILQGLDFMSSHAMPVYMRKGNSTSPHVNLEITASKRSYTVTIPDGLPEAGYSLWLYIKTSAEFIGRVEVKYENIQIEVGSTATEYEMYVDSQTLNANTPNGFPGIPVTSGCNYTDSNGQQWVCDEVDFERGVYIQRVRAIEFTGSEDWMTQSVPIENGMGIYLMNVGGEGANNSWGVPFGQFDLKCSHFTIGLSGTSGKTLNTCAFNGGLNNFLINLDTSVCGTTLTAVKSWIADQYNNGTPVTVYIALANPIETPLSSTELEAFKALCSNYPNTTVYNDANAHMQLSYNVDTKTYVDNGIKKTVAEVMEAIENGSY
jgi:hypothetical protein